MEYIWWDAAEDKQNVAKPNHHSISSPTMTFDLWPWKIRTLSWRWTLKGMSVRTLGSGHAVMRHEHAATNQSYLAISFPPCASNMLRSVEVCCMILGCLTAVGSMFVSLGILHAMLRLPLSWTIVPQTTSATSGVNDVRWWCSNTWFILWV